MSSDDTLNSRLAINKCKLSIIIPVYNVESYVEKCLNSCLAQDIPFSEYEIIVINDGTKDNSMSIVNRMASQYSNIVIIDQENAGLSSARNKGLFNAKGKYVWFVDSDDFIKINSLKRITNILVEKELDGLLIGAANITKDKCSRRKDFTELNENVYSGIELLDNKNWQTCVPFTIYNRDFLMQNNLKFYEGIFHEDSEFTPRSYYFAKRISILNEIIYFVNINPSSITRSRNPKKSFDCIIVAKRLNDFTEGINPRLYYLYDNIISMNINTALNNSYQMDIKEIKNLNKTLKENSFLFVHLKRSNIFKYRFEAFLFNCFKGRYVQFYKLLQLFNKRQYV